MKYKKIIWVVGASTGIGAELAKQLAQDGHFVVCSARSLEKLKELECVFPDRIRAAQWDVTTDENIIANWLYGETDQLDCVIYCAGTCEYQDDFYFDVARYKNIFDVNFMGLLRTLNVALPLLRKSNNQPNIVGVSSLAAKVPFPRSEIYGASKVAMDYFLQSLKVDLQALNIDVTIVRPGFVDTPLTKKNDFDMPFLMSSKSAAKIIVEGLKQKRVFIEFPWKLSWPIRMGQLIPNLWINGIAPRLRKRESL